MSKHNLNLVSNKKSGTNIYYIYITGNRPSALTPPKYIRLLEDGSVPIVFKNCPNLPNKFIQIFSKRNYRATTWSQRIIPVDVV